jgi:hypothetical protein
MNSCKECSRKDFETKNSIADCGHETSRSGMMLCKACAKKGKACEGCGTSLARPPAVEEEYELPPHTD